MLFQTITPEQAGIASDRVCKFIRTLNRRGLVMHSVLLMKGESIFGEFYWKPFHRSQNHRMYSQTKSLTGIAVGLLEEDGLVQLDDRICTYFPDKYSRTLPPYLQDLIISAFYELIADEIQPAALPEDPSAANRCRELAQNLELVALTGNRDSAFANILSGRRYLCEENNMGIREFSLEFLPDGTGIFHYTNAQGDKHLLHCHHFSDCMHPDVSRAAGCISERKNPNFHPVG